MFARQSKLVPRRPLPSRTRLRRTHILLCVRPRAVATHPAQKRRVPLAPKNFAATTNNVPSVSLRIPRTLQRPSIREVDMSAIAAAFPDLAGVPPEYIRERLPTNGSEMLSAVASVRAQANTPKDVLPLELEVVVNDGVTGAYPTHLLAVYSASTSESHRQVVLHPAHQLVLAAHCANFPILCQSSPNTSPSSPTHIKDSTVTLPVVPLCLPSADTFPILHTYLYTKRVDLLRAELVPVDAAPWNTMAALGVILGVWRNACALGVVEDGLWDTIDAAWGSVVSAMSGHSA